MHETRWELRSTQAENDPVHACWGDEGLSQADACRVIKRRQKGSDKKLFKGKEWLKDPRFSNYTPLSVSWVGRGPCQLVAPFEEEVDPSQCWRKQTLPLSPQPRPNHIGMLYVGRRDQRARQSWPLEVISKKGPLRLKSTLST